MLWMLLVATAPTYLSCTLRQEDQPLTVEIVVNEELQQATVALPTGRTVTRRAVISPSAVRIVDEESTWTIDRVDLTFGRKVVIGEQEWNDVGACKVAPTPAKRAF